MLLPAQVSATEVMTSSQKPIARFLAIALLLATGFCLLGCQNGKAVVADEKASTLATIHLESFVVNLADGRSYLRIGIDLGLENEPTKAKSELPSASVPVIRDSVITLLSTLESDDLLTPDGKSKLKQSLLKVLNDRLPELKAREIYFNEFMVQR
jgi:flagellar basal body-associated protein FliL